MKSTRVQGFDFKESTHHDSDPTGPDPQLKTNVNIYASGPPTLGKENRYLIVCPDGYGKSRPT